MLELYYNFFDKFCDVNKFEELEMDTDSLFLALAEENLHDCIRPEKKGDWEKLREKDCRDSFRADSETNFFHEHAVAFTRSKVNESLVCSKKNLGVRRCYVYAARLIVAMKTNQTRISLAAKD